jgi:glycosyltransferase involved in cell wall biosynthesis
VVAYDPRAAPPSPADHPYAGEQREGVLRRSVARVSWMRRYRRDLARWGRWVADAGRGADVWHLHDYPALSAVAPRIGGTPYVYDSHEIFMESGTAARLPGPLRRWLSAGETRLARRAVAVVTVNQACADALAGLSPEPIVVVHNCAPRREVGPPPVGPDPLRAAAGIPPGTDVILYHGGLFADRGVEQLIAAVGRPGSTGAHLVFLGYGSLRDEIAARAADPASGGRIHLLDPVLPSALLDWVARADVDAMPIQPTTLNHRLSTPNKLFESLAAGVPVVVSDFPGMRSIVMDDPDGPLGAVCDPGDPASIASAIASILSLGPDGRAELRERCQTAARDRWNWDGQARRLQSLYDSIERERSSTPPPGGAGSDRPGSSEPTPP